LLMLDNRFHHHSVAHRAADGTLSVDCGHTATPLAQSPNGAAAVAGPSPATQAQPVPPPAHAASAPPAACAPAGPQVTGALP
jgi:hypothetical protein